MASVTFQAVIKQNGDNTVLQDMRLEIADKDHKLFVGSSISGKSSCLRMLTCFGEMLGERVVNRVSNLYLSGRKRELVLHQVAAGIF